MNRRRWASPCFLLLVLLPGAIVAEAWAAEQPPVAVPANSATRTPEPRAADPIEPAADAPRPLSPEQSARKMRLPDGFRVELVASEPVVREPSCIAFDERGRLFVCELHGYNIEGYIDVSRLNQTGVLDTQVRRIRWELQGGEIAREAAQRQYGVVKLLTDTDGDGVMDKADVWADDLPPCYGIVAARAGVIVVCAPDIVYLADRDHDGRADHRETLFTGFRTRVMERGINNPRWGLDNWIYVGAGGEGGTITGPRLGEAVELGHSDFRIRSDGSAIEPVNGRVGTFGLTVNDVGDRFPSTGGRPLMYALPLPYRYLTRNPHVATPETNDVAADYQRGYRISQPHPWRVKRRRDPAWVKFYGETETSSDFFTGGCSSEFYGDALFPEEYRGNFFYCEPSLNIVHRCVASRDGAGYRGVRAPSERQSEFLASEDQWFRPMNLRVGPEGALYIVDMYREIIEDYSAIPRFLQQQYGLEKGSDHGRIWRLVPDSGPTPPVNDLSTLDVTSLVRATGASGLWTRLTAQRLLVERRETSAAEALAEQVRAEPTAGAAIHSLYTLHGLERLGPSDVAQALESRHFAVRLHALRLSETWLDSDGALRGKVLSMVDDPDPAVRLQVAMTLGQMSGGPAVGALVAIARRHAGERWMSAAILSSSNRIAAPILRDLLRDERTSDATAELFEPLAATLAGRRDARGIAEVLTAIDARDSAIQQACLRGLVDGLGRGDGAKLESPDGWAPLTVLLRGSDPEVRELATRLAGRLRVADAGRLREIFATAVDAAVDTNNSVEQRCEAVRLLAAAPFESVKGAADRLLDPRQPPALQRAVIRTLNASSDERVGPLLLERWSGYTPPLRRAALETMLARDDRLPSLLDAIQDRRIRAADLTDSQRRRVEAARDEQVAARARRLFEDPVADARLRQRIERYRRALDGPRDARIGKSVFEKHCLTCHKLGDEGFEVGPPLGSVANKPDEAVLLDLLEPSGRIEGEYVSYVVTTHDGRTSTGLLASESPTSVSLRQERGLTVTVLRRDIEWMKASDVSLMPSNIHEQIGPSDAAHLIEFLKQAFREEVEAGAAKEPAGGEP